MAVPKKKVSKSRRDMRRAHHGLKDITTTECPNCGAQKLPHHLCEPCGFYNGRQIIRVKSDTALSA